MSENTYKQKVVTTDSKAGYLLLEVIYQGFKERLIEELKVESPELLNRARLVDTEE